MTSENGACRGSAIRIEWERIDRLGVIDIEVGLQRRGRIEVQHAAVEGRDCRGTRLEEFCRAFDDGLEHRLHVGGRACDHLEDVGGRRLARQRLLGFVEQPHVFDRDHGLVGEMPQQGDLGFRERPDLLAVDGDGAA